MDKIKKTSGKIKNLKIQGKKKEEKKKINEEEFNPLLERIKKIEGKIKLMMKTLLYRTEPCWYIMNNEECPFGNKCQYAHCL